MLQLIICPKCGTEFRDTDLHFCYNCGSRLPVGDKTPSRAVSSEPTPLPFPSEWSRSRIFLWSVFSLIGISAAAAGVVYLFLPSWQSEPAPSPLPVSWEKHIFESSASATPRLSFADLAFSDAVPRELDSYLWGRFDQSFFSALLGEGAVSLLEERTELSLAELISYLGEESVLVQEASASAFFSRVRSPKFVEQILLSEGAEEILGFEAILDGDLLIVSNSRELASEVAAVREGRLLGLDRDPVFDVAKRCLPDEGQFFIFGEPVKLWLLPEQFRRSASGRQGFVIDSDGGDLVVYEVSEE